MQTKFEVFTETGLVEPAVQCASPNRDARPDGSLPRLVVLHGISLPPGQFGGTAIEAFFTNTLDHGAHPYFEEIRGMQVSAHLLVRRDGSVLQFVPLTERAWHAGESCFRGATRCNDYSIGIELEGEDESPYDDRQYEALAPLLRAIFDAYPDISAREVAGHCDIAPGRKSDPGPAFDWLRLYDVLGGA
jgi:AmpD protein